MQLEKYTAKDTKGILGSGILTLSWAEKHILTQLGFFACHVRKSWRMALALLISSD